MGHVSRSFIALIMFRQLPNDQNSICAPPYLYSEFLKAALQDEMMFEPLAFEFPDDSMAKQVEDQLLLGKELMIAPVYKQNAQGRYVYLPEEMMLVRMRSCTSYETTILLKGHHYIAIALDELVFFIRKQKSIPLAKPAANTEQIDLQTCQLLGYPNSSYELYADNGILLVRKTVCIVLHYETMYPADSIL